MTDGQWTDKQKKQMDILENLKAKKIIRAHGVSIHSLEALEACVDCQWVDVVHVRVNPYGDSMDRRDPAEVIAVIEKLHKAIVEANNDPGIRAMIIASGANPTSTSPAEFRKLIDEETAKWKVMIEKLNFKPQG
jgi:predicted aldo/keto reductase-like oxidoreductase